MDEDDSNSTNVMLPVWKTYLYQLQLQAPKPKAILRTKNLANAPSYYGHEYHGMITRQEAEFLLGNDDGNFLVRESNNPPGSATLAIKFSNETKNYKMYYDGAFYVGEKRFDSIIDLVHDGLISFYIEKHASNYIAMMCEENNYSESPYVASRTALLLRQKRSSSNNNNNNSIQIATPPPPPPSLQQQQQHSLSLITPTASLSSSSSHHHQHQQQSQILLPSSSSTSTPSSTTFQQNSFQQQQQQSSSIHQQLQAQFSQHNNGQSQGIIDKENKGLNSLIKPSLVAGNNILLLNNRDNKSNAIFDRFYIMNSEKSHRFKSQNFKGPQWCDFCLNFMWGLVSQGVKCQDCGFQAHKKCSERTPPDCEPQMRYIKRIFGVDLTTLVKATNSIRPIVVEKCIEEIEKRKGALETEGVYRVSGLNDAIEELRLAFDRGDNIDLSDTCKYNDIHLICSLLKLFLRQLPIPLITFDVYNRLIEVLTSTNSNLKGVNLIEQIKSCIIELPPAHYLTLKFLMEHLVKVARHSSKNQMNYENLAIVFGPTLMRSCSPDPIIALKNTHKEQKIAEFLITNYFLIFDR